MPTVSVIVRNAAGARGKIAALFHKQFKLGLGELLKSIDASRPIVQQELFPRDDPAFAERFAAVLDALERMQVAYSAYVHLPGQASEILHPITPAYVRRQIEVDKRTIEEIQRNVDREVGEDDD